MGKDGLYRVSFQELQDAGFPVTDDPRRIQLFHRGKEQAIHVEGEDDGVLDPHDYIEFYGRRNDGALDSSLYADPSYQPHRYYNLYSDTTAYFLTIGIGNGKRMPLYSPPLEGAAPVQFHYAEKMLVLSDTYSAGREYGSNLLSMYDLGEGWTGAPILQGQQREYSIDGIADAASGNPLLEILLTGRGAMMHEVEIFAGPRLLTTVSFPGFESEQHTSPLSWSDITNGKLTVTVRVTGQNGPDRASVGYIRVVFPQRVTMNGQSERVFGLNADSGTKLLRIQDTPANVRLFDITDPSSPVRIATRFDQALEAVVSGDARQVLATNNPLNPTKVERVSFRKIEPSLHDYIIIAHPLLRRPASGYSDPVKAFAEYRSLPQGGGFDTLVVNVDQLYNQFNYGETSPRAIYQFMKFLAAERLPRFLFLIGKGLDVDYAYLRYPGSFNAYRDLVPTAGYPASDMLFTAGLGGNNNIPAVATGRLTANTPAEVASYLNKVKERDALPFNDLNRKKILHLSGGIEEHEPLFFRQILEGYATIAEDMYLGGKVQAIAKRSTDIKLVNIANEVNRGVGLITFFGHSAPTTFDFDIGLVSDPVMGYNNAGKYPFMLMNGCDAGSFFLTTDIPGENWIKTPAKGAIGFIAHSSYGLVQGLQAYSSTFYNVAFADSVFIKRGVGEVQREVARRVLSSYGVSPAYISQVQQMVLLGDPAIRVFGASKPDFSPVAEGISFRSFSEESITAFADSFQIAIPVRNYGIARAENIRINVRREYNAGQTIEYDEILSPVLFEDTVRITVRNQDRNGYGINRFVIFVDADDLVDEMDEGNNTVSIDYFIPLNSTRNLYPFNHAIVPRREVVLSFQLTDALSGSRDLLLEIDTTRSFNSQVKKEFRVNANVLARHPVVLEPWDSTVYFWRTRIAEPLETESQEWTVSSFAYIAEGPEGWAQLHFEQIANNSNIGLVSDPAVRLINFRETTSEVTFRIFASSAGKPLDSASIKINDVEFNLLYEGGACRNNTINLIAFDRRSTQPYPGLYFKWYEILWEYGGRRLLCGREPYVINSFTPGELVTGNGDDLIGYVDNVHLGDSVVIFNLGNAGFSLWPAEARTKLGEVGVSAAQLDVLADGDAVVIFGRKGSSPGTAEVYRASGGQQELQVDRTITGRFTSGVMSSGFIGPAKSWDRFIPKVGDVDDTDTYSFMIIGVKTDGAQDTLQRNVTSEEILDFVDPSIYPYLRVSFETGDDIDLTAVQLSQWMVLFEPFAEGMVVYLDDEVTRQVPEGETVRSKFGFINASDKTFPDSLVVRTELVNHTNGPLPSSFRLYPPAPGDTTQFVLTLPTVGNGGFNDLRVFVNPRIVPELTFDNNVIHLDNHLQVKIDDTAPVLSVTFDGRQLRDLEYVTANPSIEISLHDDNVFFLKTDTLGVRVFLAYPCAIDPCPLESIYFDRDDITWSPATVDSDFLVKFTPRGLEEGTYRLRVEAGDALGNSVQDPYEIRFQVDKQSSVRVTEMHPNPFSFDTKIDVVVAAASESNLQCHVEILATSGRLIRVLSTEEGSLHVGYNTIRWDGTQSDGSYAPAGVYIYRLTVAGGDKSSVHYGRVVLVR